MEGPRLTCRFMIRTKNLSYFLSGIGQQFTTALSMLLDVEVRLTLG
jgi:hypothetical protein